MNDDTPWARYARLSRELAEFDAEIKNDLEDGKDTPRADDCLICLLLFMLLTQIAILIILLWK